MSSPIKGWLKHTCHGHKGLLITTTNPGPSPVVVWIPNSTERGKVGKQLYGYKTVEIANGFWKPCE